MIKKMIVFCGIALLSSMPIFGVVRSQSVTYNATFKGSSVVCQGVMVYDTIPGVRPGILMVPQWMGITDHERQRAEQWVRQGFTVFIADIYGGMVPKDVTEAAKLSTKFKKNVALTRSRAKAALDVLKASSKVDPANVAALGYCFGGGVVLELARSGEPLKAFISFHGNLDSPSSNTKVINGDVLVLHGADDPYVPWEQVTAFKKEMQKAKANWSLGVFGNAVHGFTQRNTGVEGLKGVGYNLTADQDSWLMARQLLRRVTGK